MISTPWKRAIITEDGNITDHEGLITPPKGVLILKDGPFEKKLCHLSIDKAHQNKGIGIKLFRESFERLGTEKPYFTIQKDKVGEFKKIINHFGFELTKVVHNEYGKEEHHYNEDNRYVTRVELFKV